MTTSTTSTELELFSVPSTQTAIDSYYEVEFRSSLTLGGSTTYDFNIPVLDDYTDLSETMIHVVGRVDKGGQALTASDTCSLCTGFASALFEQIQFYLKGFLGVFPRVIYHLIYWLSHLVVLLI